MKQPIHIFWFRRDLRLQDNIGLFHALENDIPVLPIFIFDKNILHKLPESDARVSFIFKTIEELNKQLKKNEYGSIATFYGSPSDVINKLTTDYTVHKVHANRDYEPSAIKRDNEVKELLEKKSIDFNLYKDQVIFEQNEIVKNDGKPYVVYTPYKNKWKEHFEPSNLRTYNSEDGLHNILKITSTPKVTLKEMGFTESDIKVLDYRDTKDLIENYEETRNYPAIKHGTSKLAPHLRFGTVGIRTLMKKAIATKNEMFWSELVWREFFMQILWHFPHTQNKSFRPKYDRIEWRNNESEFEAWKEGKTGYPLVDAGMRELNTTGYMHNRVRMLVASFLCKHLLIDWRWGEAYFAEKLLDYDMSANVGNWQWAAGSGVDAAPYFRIFNPTTQIQKFDTKLTYINTWVKDINEFSYPSPIVDHKMARERCLKTYKEAVG